MKPQTQMFQVAEENETEKAFMISANIYAIKSIDTKPEFQEKYKNNGDDIKNWLPDSGATTHFTPYLDDLEDVQPCQIEVLVADGSYFTATHQGTVKLRFTLDQGTRENLP